MQHGVMRMDDELCFRAVQGRDSRFDGWFVMAVRTTGIYCRPSCPALTPRRHNVEFFPAAATAQSNGYDALLIPSSLSAYAPMQWSPRETISRSFSSKPISTGMVFLLRSSVC